MYLSDTGDPTGVTDRLLFIDPGLPGGDPDPDLCGEPLPAGLPDPTGLPGGLPDPTGLPAGLPDPTGLPAGLPECWLSGLPPPPTGDPDPRLSIKSNPYQVQQHFL